MELTCLNCGKEFEGLFCPQCGQKASVKRLTFSSLAGEVVHFFTHLEHGFLYTTYCFLRRPGVSSLEYVAGKRNRYQKPVSYFLIWTGLYILLHNYIIEARHFQFTDIIISEMNLQEQSNLLFRKHFTLFILPVIFLSALILYIMLGRPRYNYVEILTLSLYGAGTYFMLSLLGDLLLGVVLGINILRVEVFLWQLGLSGVYNFWFTYDFFRRMKLRFFWLRLIGASVAIGAAGWLVMLYLPLFLLRSFLSMVLIDRFFPNPLWMLWNG